MMRLFFDVVGPNTRSVDYHGRYFSNHVDAHNAAQMLSLDLSCTEQGPLEEVKVEVRDPSGQHLFSIPVMQLTEECH